MPGAPIYQGTRLALPGLSVRRYGARGDGVANDTAPILATIAASQHAATLAGISGSRIYLPPGAYRISDTLLFDRFGGLIEGAGWTNPPNYQSGGSKPGYGTTLIWDGPNTKPMMRLTDSWGARVSGIRFQGNDAANPTAGVEFLSEAGDTVGANQNLSVRDCYFGSYPYTAEGADVGDMAYGVLVDGVNAGNTQITIEDCRFNRCLNYGMLFLNTASLRCRVRGVHIAGGSGGVFSSAPISLQDVFCSGLANDLVVQGDAAMRVRNYESEGCTGTLGTLSSGAKLYIDGFRAQCAALTGHLFNGFPSANGQVIGLRDGAFEQAIPAGAKIRMRPSAGANTLVTPPKIEVINVSGYLDTILDIDGVDSVDTRVVRIETNMTNVFQIRVGV